MKTRKTNTFKAPQKVFFVFLVFLLILFIQYCYLALFPSVYGINMKEFASNRNTYSKTIYAKRGTVYDDKGNTLAIDVSSYTVVAYLDESRTGSSTTLYHVKDKQATAKALSPILNCSEEFLLNLFNQDLYQTYLGTYGTNISEITKNKIEELHLPGIEFEESYKRYYPNGDFASYIVGYAKKQNAINVQKGKTYDLNSLLKNIIGDHKNITFNSSSDNLVTITEDGLLTANDVGTVTINIKAGSRSIGICVVAISNGEVVTKLEDKIFGELGIEIKYEDILRGSNGYLEYQVDRFGYKIPDTPEDSKEAQSGSDIYLTIDSNIQRILEAGIKEAQTKDDPEWITINVMDAKTGDILGSASTPSFNPNDLSTLVNYENPLTSFNYEPGSVMKIFTYMCAMEKGTYNGSQTFPSGSIQIEDKRVYDWNRVGWGTISYDYGFQQSSNVGVSYIMQNFLTKEDLKACLNNYGFGSTTGIQLPRELSGKIVFNQPIEVAAAAYGQGIWTTAVQQLQALSIIANNGTMVKPNIIKKIVDTNTGKITYESSVQKVENVVSSNTTDQIKKLMYNTVNDTVNGATGTRYRVNGLEVIGKTGTAEVYDSELGGYVQGNNIYSFSGMFPYDDPQIIIFVSVNRPKSYSNSTIINLTQPVIESIAKYKGLIKGSTSIDNDITKNILPSYTNQKTETVKQELEALGLKPVIVGDGDKIVNQYPYKSTTVLTGDKVFLLTNAQELTMPSFKDYSRIEAISLLNLLNIAYEIDGNGVVVEQSIEAGSKLSDTKLKLTLKPKYNFDE